MRIGLLIVGSNDGVSGGYLYNRKLVDFLESRGDEVEIISLPPAPYPALMANNWRGEVFDRLLHAGIDILIQDELVHPAVCFLNRRLRAQATFPVITLVHLLTAYDRHPFYSAWLKRRLERRYLESVDGMILNSRTSADQARELVGIPLPPNCIAVPAGDNFGQVSIGPGDVARRAQAPGPLRVLVVGNVIHRKGLHVLLDALAGSADPDVEVKVAGRLDMEPGYTRLIHDLLRQSGLKDRVTLLGPVAGQALADLYREHHVMALPSAFEGYGIVYVEAQQFGLPVIGTTAGAAHEIIDDGVNGYLVAPGDSQALAARLKGLQDDRRLLARLGNNALDAYAAHPSWNASCDIIRHFLQARLTSRNATP